MQWQTWISQISGSFDPRTALFLFAICGLGEFIVSVPYALESIWLLAGYQLGHGVLSPLGLMGLWLAAQCGRQTGNLALFYIARLSSSPFSGLYRKLTNSRFWPKAKINNRLLGRINVTSPFSLAYGRLLGLRFPLTIILALKNKIASAMTGVLLSSIIWDAIYITLGATIGKTVKIQPVQMLIASVAGLTLLYLIVFLARLLYRRLQPARQN
ncbi:MAG TPA: hypothetical protein VMB24_03775 [Dehalococcoidales bacterium]|nr:hypothetical protein [Dehalococcoidales bacterium]